MKVLEAAVGSGNDWDVELQLCIAQKSCKWACKETYTCCICSVLPPPFPPPLLGPQITRQSSAKKEKKKITPMWLELHRCVVMGSKAVRRSLLYHPSLLSVSKSKLKDSLTVFSQREGSRIWKMHILKGTDGLGIQITGGRGSKRSPHSIIVTHVEEGGSAHR